MKKILNTNWFWIIFIITLGITLEFTTNFDALFLFVMIGIWIVTVFYHECGHWFFAKTRKMELFMISSFAGMYMNKRWYFSIPVYISWGVRYVQTYKKRQDDKERFIVVYIRRYDFQLDCCRPPAGNQIYFQY